MSLGVLGSPNPSVDLNTPHSNRLIETLIYMHMHRYPEGGSDLPPVYGISEGLLHTGPRPAYKKLAAFHTLSGSCESIHKI